MSTYNPSYHQQSMTTLAAESELVRTATFQPEILGNRNLQSKYNNFVLAQYAPQLVSSTSMLQQPTGSPDPGPYDPRTATLPPPDSSKMAAAHRQEQIYQNHYTEPGYRQHEERSTLMRGGSGPLAYSDSVYNVNNPPQAMMDPKLTQFVDKYCVEMSDGAVLVKTPGAKSKTRKPLIDRQSTVCGFPIIPFIVILIVLLVVCLVLILGLGLGLTLGAKPVDNFPEATIWWKRTLFYEIDIPTEANDVGGTIGRLQDSVERVPYYYHQVGALALILNNLVFHDQYGVRDFQRVDTSIDPDEKGMTLLAKLKQKALQPDGPRSRERPIDILMSLPLYATSSAHVWFETGQKDSTRPEARYYIWRNDTPINDQERRVWYFSNLRRLYYRHQHGQPARPLLNLANVDVQNQLVQAIMFWRQQLDLKGIMVANSSMNVIPEMVDGLRKILQKVEDDQFIWFADDPLVDEQLGNPNICFTVINIKARVQRRSDDLSAQIKKFSESTRAQQGCVLITRVDQLSDSSVDYQAILALAYYLPGNFLMKSGQEVFIEDTRDQLLMKWANLDYLNYETYVPVKFDAATSRSIMNDWVIIKNAIWRGSLLRTDPASSPSSDLSPQYSLADVAIYKRTYLPTGNSIYFVVSFTTLNIQVKLDTIIANKAYVMLDSKNQYSSKTVSLSNIRLQNNQILLLYT